MDLEEEEGKERKASTTSFPAEEAAKDDAGYCVFLAPLYKAQRTGVQYGKSPGSERREAPRGAGVLYANVNVNSVLQRSKKMMMMMIIIIMTIVIIIRDICQIKDDENALEAVAWGSEAGRRRAAVVCSGSNPRTQDHDWAEPPLPPSRQGAGPGDVPCPDCGRSSRDGAPRSPLFLDTSGIWWQDPLFLAAMEASLDVAEMAALQKAANDSSDSSHLEGDSTKEVAVQNPELEAIKARVREMEKEAKWMRELQMEAESGFAGNLEAGLFSRKINDKTEADQRSIYVGNVDYEATAEELEVYFSSCGEINRVTILCDKFSGHPKGYAYIEFEEKSSMKAAMELDESLFKGRVIKVLPKRTNTSGNSITGRGGYQGPFQAWGGLAQWEGYYGGQYSRVQGRDHAELLPWYVLERIGLPW
ncbi:embryonic polyadenylate-binding protein 2 [Strigops habroptila]|uniref:embryonic polyadenylate-binding protein 2 n=1 Tax=Strigops habroptila TaxID=2489341 RepID=UPI0011CF77CB|nr:embryonic polyadenylate-binding protein 2 [Strigops habroptila]